MDIIEQRIDEITEILQGLNEEQVDRVILQCYGRLDDLNRERQRKASESSRDDS